MDNLRRLRRDEESDEQIARPRSPTPSGLDGLEKMLRVSMGGREGEPEESRERLVSAISAREIAQAMDLVHEAAKNIRLAEERARDGEARAQSLLQRATEELKGMEARIQSTEARARAAEARAQDAEARAKEAEGWLQQIFSTICQELPPRS